MKKKVLIFAAVLATCLTACSFFNKESKIEDDAQLLPETILCEVELKGGSGRATVESPAEVTPSNKKVKLVWSSSHYDYMLVDSVRYDNEAPEGSNSVFTIPFSKYGSKPNTSLDGMENPILSISVEANFIVLKPTT